MFSTLLDAVESLCPDSHTKLSLEQHKELIDEVLPWLSIESAPLIGAAKALLGENLFNTSELGFEYSSTKPDQNGYIDVPVSIGSMYIRPEKENRAISLNLTVFRGFMSRLQIHPPSIDIELEICDIRAKEAFESLYKDYRGQINRLLEHAQITFSTSYCSDIVGKSKSNKVSAKLDEYFSDPETDNCFSISKPCPRQTGHSTAIRAFLALSVLYIACRTSLAGKSERSVFERNLLRLV